MYEAIFLSDIHLGLTKKEEKIFSLLKNIETKNIFLVGDIISFSVDKPNKILDEFFQIIKNKNSKIYYLLGNHEKENLNFQNLESYYKDIELLNKYIFNFKDKKIFIEHGDSFHYKDPFNRAVKKFMLNYKIKVYKNSKNTYPKVRKSYYKIKPLIKFFLYKSYINYMVKLAKQNSCNVVICGHLHSPDIKKIKNITYYNCGDWLKNNSYLVLKETGDIELKTL